MEHHAHRKIRDAFARDIVAATTEHVAGDDDKVAAAREPIADEDAHDAAAARMSLRRRR
jgi:hypothetical protein